MNNLDFTKDLAKWNEVAPEGATHYDPGGNGDEPSFMKYDCGDWFWVGFDEVVWELYGANPPEALQLLEARVIPKPSDEQGLVVGEVYNVANHTHHNGYYYGQATLLCEYENFYWVIFNESESPVSFSGQHVTLTKPNPERKKWIEAVVSVMADKHLQNEWQVAEVIYDSGLAGEVPQYLRT